MSSQSSLLHAILGELETVDGHVSVSGRVSFASQDHWIFPGTVKRNILFGDTFDLNRYQKVLEVCGLDHDIQQWKEGDDTWVGERGIKLSGGQKVILMVLFFLN